MRPELLAGGDARHLRAVAPEPGGEREAGAVPQELLQVRVAAERALVALQAALQAGLQQHVGGRVGRRGGPLLEHHQHVQAGLVRLRHARRLEVSKNYAIAQVSGRELQSGDVGDEPVQAVVRRAALLLVVVEQQQRVVHALLAARKDDGRLFDKGRLVHDGLLGADLGGHVPAVGGEHVEGLALADLPQERGAALGPGSLLGALGALEGQARARGGGGWRGVGAALLEREGGLEVHGGHS